MSSIPAQNLSPAVEDDGQNNSGDVGSDPGPFGGGVGAAAAAATAAATENTSPAAAPPTPPPPPEAVAEATLDMDIDVDEDEDVGVDVEAVLGEESKARTTTTGKGQPAEAATKAPRWVVVSEHGQKQQPSAQEKPSPSSPTTTPVARAKPDVPPPLDVDVADADAYGYLRYRFAGCMMRCGANGKGLALLNMRPKRDVAVQILANELVVLLLGDREGGIKGGKDEDGTGAGAGANEGGQRGRRRRLIRDLLVERGATIARPAGADASLDTVGALAEDLVDLGMSVDEERAAAAAVAEGSGDTAAAVVAKDDNVSAAVCRVEGCTEPTALGPRRGFLCADHLAANRPTPPGDPQEGNPQRQQPPECSVDWCHARARKRHRGMCALHGREFVRSSSAKLSKKLAAELSKKLAAAETVVGSKHRSPKSKSMSMSNSAKGPSVAKKIPPAARAAKSGGETTTSPARSGANQARERRTWEACRRFGVPYVPPPAPPGPGVSPDDGVEGEIRRRARVDAMVSACHDAWEAEKRRGADEVERLRRKDETRRLFEAAAAAEAARAAGARLGGGGGDGANDDDKPPAKKRPRVRDPSLPPARKVVDPFTLKTRYVCSVEGCVKYSVRDGICIAHGAKRKTECKIPGCTRYMVSQGVCIGHGAKRKTTCKVEGCTKYRVSNGVCIAHGGKRKTECRVPGCTKYMVSKGVCIAHGGKRKTECKVEGCTKYRVSNGVCISHGGKRKLLCTAEGCSRVRVSDSMCALHCGAKSKAPAARKKRKDDASAGIAGSTTKTEKAPGTGHKDLGSGSPTDAKVDMIEMPGELNV